MHETTKQAELQPGLCIAHLFDLLALHLLDERRAAAAANQSAQMPWRSHSSTRISFQVCHQRQVSAIIFRHRTSSSVGSQSLARLCSTSAPAWHPHALASAEPQPTCANSFSLRRCTLLCRQACSIRLSQPCGS